eukprot:scaffold12121_cov57-Phaeocystis_antarctica.AAC.4
MDTRGKALLYVEIKVAQTAASWRPGGLCQHQVVLQAAPTFGQPRPISRLGRAGRPYRPCFSHRHPCDAGAKGMLLPVTGAELARCARRLPNAVTTTFWTHSWK